MEVPERFSLERLGQPSSVVNAPIENLGKRLSVGAKASCALVRNRPNMLESYIDHHLDDFPYVYVYQTQITCREMPCPTSWHWMVR